MKSKTTSNTMRAKNYRSIRKELGVDKLNQIISIDPVSMTATVQPGVCMDALAEACLRLNVIVPVLPEFKGITVGGAINGAAIESSSFQYGQFNDNVLSMDVLLGNGERITASPHEYQDLFYGMSGAYGSFGIITLVKLRLIPTKPYIALSYHRFQKIAEGLEKLDQLQKSQTPPDFMEGLVFAKDNIVVIEGHFVSEKSNNHLSLKNPFGSFFYSHVKKTQKSNETIPTEDYLFRYDRGAFWMGAYASHYKLFFRYFVENFFNKSLKKEKNVILKPDGLFFRLFFGWWMSSRKLYRMLHSNTENWFKENFIIQDYYIPIKNAEDFISRAIEETAIFPIWLCPVKGTSTAQFLSPHYGDQIFLDIGIYGLPRSEVAVDELNRDLDGEAKRLVGRKMLYSFNYYTEEEFFSIYSKEQYEELREKYHANDVLLNIQDKVL